MAVSKTIQFLPEVFRTDTNRKFLNATLDQLISEPRLKKINGYIGRKLSPAFKSSDNYIVEPTTDRQNYQLEPSLIIRNPVTNDIDFATTYTDIINQIKYYGGLADRHDRLFDSEYYSYNPHIDLDKFINFSQYYWLENGPDAVTISALGVPLNHTYTVLYDAVSKTYNFIGNDKIPNPSITLARGGVYNFVINDAGNPFYIQSKAGSSGVNPALPNLGTRSVLGVTNNGTESGIVTFTVPTQSSQNQWTSMPLAGTVDYATNLSYQTLQGADFYELNNSLGGIDGINAVLDGKTVVFVNNQYIDDQFWHEVTGNITDGIVDLVTTGQVIPLTQRNDIYSIAILPDSAGVSRVVLERIVTVNNEQKVQIRAGLDNVGREYFCRNELLLEIPQITAPLNNLYYQSGVENTAVGIINIIDPASSTLDPSVDIIGKANYTSPSGVIFTNGLKVAFDSSVVTPFSNNTYYVEGVGTSIKLVLVSSLVSPELNNILTTPDYFTVNRSSIDQNAWSRSNRWFHSSVIQLTADQNKTLAVFDQTLRANRPIIEFNSDLQLFNYGTSAKLPIDILDTVVTDAYVQVQGVICDNDISHVFDINGTPVTLVAGTRVVFTNDVNNDVRNKIYNFTIELTTELPAAPVYRAYISETIDTQVLAGHTVVVNMNADLQSIVGTVDGENNGKQWYYNGDTWSLCQQKTSANQSPLFDVIDGAGISFSDASAYSGSTFIGTKIFSYQIGTGTVDPVLGIPLSYRNFVTQGDIQFDNNFDIDSFSYLNSAGASTMVEINTGLLQKNITRDTSIRQNIWNIVQHFSKQYQTYSFTYDGVTNLFPIDYLPDLSTDSPNIKVTVNNTPISTDYFATTKIVDRLAILINPSIIKANDAVFVNIYNSNLAAPNAFYEVPINLDINSLNSNLQTLTLGQMRNHLISLKNNSLNIIGPVPGDSNLRDVEYLSNRGSILQHSSPVVYAGLFLTHPIMNFVNGIKFANNEYTKFKTKFLELSTNPAFDRNDISGTVDNIMGIINDIKNDSFPWLYSDMVPYSAMGATQLPTYTVINPELRSYEISSIFQDTVLSNKAVFVYLTRVVDNVSSKVLLVKDQDYIFEQDRPAITFTDGFALLYNDLIDIVEYNNTDGSYVPETPTKMGMYPKFIPEIHTDNTYRTPIQVIQGHDGSITPAFGDYRDQLLLELERRIYNNIKVKYDTNLFNLKDYVPGKFRVTSYAKAEFDQIMSQGFLSWVGTNRVDYTTNKVFQSSDPFTWNYRRFRDVINGESLPGSWRSIYRYFYDTERPHTHPWEMLGFSEKPDYWETRYGPAPYTGGNSILWSDLSLGYIHAGERAGLDARYQRPNLAQIIPVDDNGNLRNPSEMLVADFDSSKANTSYAVGDMGPAEHAWATSSEYPFMMQLALALAKPARYFSLLSNVQTFARDPITAQFIVTSTGQHITPQTIKVNGYTTNDVTERSSGYINYIRDYIKSLGIADAEMTIKDNLSALSVQLSYKMAGYSDKKYINLLAEQSSPSSINDSIVIPDENYRLELFKGTPVNKIAYSAVIIEKSDNGWTVSGYNTSSPYFFVIPSLPNNNAYTITSGTQRAVVYKDYQRSKVTVPYGFEFNTPQQVVDFLVSYQRYLVSQGFIFTAIENSLKEEKNWILSAKEFLHWNEQGWKAGNIIVLSPISTELSVYDSTSVVDEITNTPYGSKVLDVNFNVIRKNDFTVFRENNLFTLRSNADQTIGFAELSFAQYEHLLILDNQTSFNDIIYVPELGNRQYRLKILGSKTDLWNGSLELPGFIHSSKTAADWNSGTDYLKGAIVKNKSQYYTALQDIVAADKFQSSYWKLIPATELKSGLVNNFATNASQALNFYDIDNQPVDEQMQTFSDGLIGFRNRSYFTNLGIDYTTQSKFYQGMIKQKGTLNALNALQGAQFNNINTGISLYENWAVRVGEYGATDLNPSIEVLLDERKLTTNPSAIQFVDTSMVAEPNIVEYQRKDIYKLSSDWDANIFRTEDNSISLKLASLPVAGFVNSTDVDATIFDMADYSTLTTIVGQIGTGYKIWTARDFNNEWNVFRTHIIPGTIFALTYKIDSTIQLRHTQPHGLVVDDVIVLKNFDPLYNGVYKVTLVVDEYNFYVELYQNLQSITVSQLVLGNGILYKLVSVKIDNPSEVDNIRPSEGWISNDKVWVENLDSNKNWGVYNKTNPWNYADKIELNQSQYAGQDHFGKAVIISPDGQLLYGGAPDSTNGRVSIFKNTGSGWTPFGFLWGNSNNLSKFGEVLATGSVGGSGYLAVGAPASASNRGYVYLFKDQILIQTLAAPTGTTNDLFGKSIAMSNDGRFIYIGAPGAAKVYCYGLNGTRPDFAQQFVSDGTRTKFALTSVTVNDIDAIVTKPLRSAEYIPFVDYTVSQFANGVKSVAGTYDATTDYYAISGSTAVAPLSTTTYYNVSATGGTGSGAKFNVLLTPASTQYSVQIVDVGSGYALSNTLTILGSAIGGVDGVNNLTITVASVFTGTNIVFNVAPVLGEKIAVTKRADYYSLIETLPNGSESAGGNGFGSALVCNADGSAFAIGANKQVSGSISGSGSIYIYHRTVTEFVTDGVRGTYTLPNSLNVIRRVTLDGVILTEGYDYYIVGNSVQFAPYAVPAQSKKLVVESNQFVYNQQLSGTAGNNFAFGDALAMCGTGCNIFVSSAGYNESNYHTGSVTRFINVGRVYGTITGSIMNPTVTTGHSLIINNRPVNFIGSTLDLVVSSINAANISGVTAVNYGGKLQINSTVNTIGNKLDIQPGTGTAITDLGLDVYILSQVIKHPEISTETFGSAIAVNSQSSVLAIASNGGDIARDTVFDADNTTFDSNSTHIHEVIKDSGAVYVFDLMRNPYESATTPSVFAYTQKLTGPNIYEGFNFGASIAIYDGSMVIGVSNDYDIVTEGGSIYDYNNPTQQSGWDLIRYKEPRVDIGAINSAFIYNTSTKLLIDHLDHLDPAKGKILGVVDQYLDYKEAFDPATYNSSVHSNTIKSSSFYWSDKHVGKTWWDLSTASFVDYEQDTLAYRLKNWGALFPGSQVNVYEWVESSVPPSQYVTKGGDGVPKYGDNTAYSLISIVDPATGMITQKYYFWVLGKTSVDIVKTNRSLSTTSLEQYITNPRDQGIPYLATLSPNSVGLYNISDLLIGNLISLNLNFGKNQSNNLIHNEYELIQEGNPLQAIPDRIITKLRDSLAGFDNQGFLVPDYQLSPQDQIGLSLRPRQSVFINRLAALKNYINSLNSFLLGEPILLTTVPSLLYKEDPLPTTGVDTVLNSEAEFAYIDTATFPDGYTILIPQDSNYNNRWSLWTFNGTKREFTITKIQSYKTPLFWTPIDWYDSSFFSGTKIDYIVNTYGNIETLSLKPNDYVKVLDNGNGQWLVYVVNADGTLKLQAAQNASIQLNQSIYDVTLGTGFDTAVFDLVDYDPQIGLEFVNIFDSMHTEILIKDLAYKFNALFFNLVNYIFTEQKSPDWIFKTSFIDIYHNIRNLEQIPTYVQDNQSFYRDYISEVKPYRTILKDYIPVYDGNDTATGNWTDFDLPSHYDSTTGTYRSLDIANASDASALQSEPYVNWTNGHTYKVTDFIIGNAGINYSIAPNVEITGGGGGGATAISTIDPVTGKLTDVTVISSGEGYTSTPTITINGTGTGAIVYPLMKNEYYTPAHSDSYNTIRNVVTELKFDRVNYSSNIVMWEPLTGYPTTVISSGNTAIDSGNVWVSSGNIVIFNSQAFLAGPTASITTLNTFDYTRFTPINSGNVLLKAVDRIGAYYVPATGMPGTDPQGLMYGLDYPQTKVTAAKFTACSFAITSNVISFNYTGLTINSGNIQQVDFQKLGFAIDQPIRVQALVPFDFSNNGYFTIVNVSHDYMTLTGQPVETTYNLLTSAALTANIGDIITQDTTSASAYIMANVVNSRTFPIIHINNGFDLNIGTLYINGISTGTIAQELSVGGNVNATISYLELDTTVLDSNIYSKYLDTALGTRPEDINIVGGAYVDTYNSHAPEELVPGRMYDALEMQVFTNVAPYYVSVSSQIYYTWSTNNLAYTSTFSVAGQDTNPVDVFFKPDGSKMFMVGATGQRVYEYLLSTPWDTTTATYTTAQRVSISSQTTTPTGLYFKPDGTKMFVIGTTNDRVYEYTLGTPWAVNTASNVGVSLSTTAIDTTPQALSFSADGRLMFIVGTAGDKVSTYTLSTAWQMNTAAFSNSSSSIASVETTATGLAFRDDGSKMFIIGTTGDNIAEYSLSTPWDVATISYIGGYSVAAQEASPSGLYIKPDGSTFYVVGSANDAVRTYSIQSNTVYDSTLIESTDKYGYRVFEPMSGNVEYRRISANTTTVLSADLGIADTHIYITDSSIMPDANPTQSIPGIVFINGEKIHYYQKYDSSDLAAAATWTANTAYGIGGLITVSGNTYLTLGNVYANAAAYINSANVQQVYSNTLTQIRRGVDGTGANIVHATGSRVVDSSVQQLIPGNELTITTFTGNVIATANVTWKLTLSSPITANIGDYITQFIGNTGNARVLDSVVSANVVAVDFVGGNIKLASNIGTHVNIATPSSYTTTTANVVAMQPLGQVQSNGNVVVNSLSMMHSNVWVPMGTGVGLNGSTTKAANFIKAEKSYIP